MDKKNVKPWENLDGSLKSNSEIKGLCKTWSAAAWEEYLKTIEVRQNESPLATGESVEELSEEKYGSLFANLIGDKEHAHLSRAARAAVESLTPEQKQIILDIYWDNKTVSDVARQRGISRTSVRDCRNRALKFLGSVLISGALSKSIKISRQLEKDIPGSSTPAPPSGLSEGNVA